MADARITINATDLASDVFAKVNDALKQTGQTTLEVARASEEAKGHTETFAESVNKLGSSFVARVAEGVLLRDAVHEVIDVVKEGIVSFPELVEHTIKVGNQIYEMSLKTGASVENLSALRYVASQTGIDFDSFGNTLYKMEVALGASGAKADQMQEHLDKLGLSMQDLKNEKPDQAFIDIMSALEDMPNRTDQAAAGMAIFGKGFKEMAGLTQESITDLMAEAKDLGLVMTTETAAAAHAAEIGFKGFSMQLEAVGMEVGATVLPALVALTKLVSGEFHSAVEGIGHPVVDLKQVVEDVIMKLLDWSSVGISTAQFLDNAFQGTKAMLFDIEAKVIGVGLAFVNMALSAAEVANKIPGMRGEFAGLTASLQDSSTWLGGFQDGLQRESDAAIDAAGKHGVYFDALRNGIGDMKAHFGEAFSKASEEIADFADKSKKSFGGVGADVEGAKDKVDKYADAWTNLASIGTDYADTVANINPLLVGEITYFIEAGARVSDLADAYKDKLTPSQIEAIDKMVKANEKYAASWLKTQEDIDRIWDRAFFTEQENNLRGLDLQLAKLRQQEQNEIDAATKKITDETQLQAMLEAIEADYGARRANLIRTNNQKLGDEINKLWSDVYEAEAQEGMTSAEKQIASVQKWYDDKVIKAIEAGVVDQTYYDNLYALADRKTRDVIKLNDPWYKANQAFRQTEESDWNTLYTAIYGGWADTFDKTLLKTGSFKDAATAVFDSLKSAVEHVFADMLTNLLQGFFAPLEKKLGSMLAELLGLGKASSGDEGGLAGFLGSLFGGGGGGGDSPIGWNPYGPAPGGSPSIGGAPGNDDYYVAEGGVIGPRYLGSGGPVTFPGSPRGIDTVPIWAAEGEGMLNRDAMRTVGEPMLNQLNRGGEILNTRALENKIDDLHLTFKRVEQQMRDLPNTMTRSLRDALVLAGR